MFALLFCHRKLQSCPGTCLCYSFAIGSYNHVGVHDRRIIQSWPQRKEGSDSEQPVASVWWAGHRAESRGDDSGSGDRYVRW